jgi:hypothetical protein
MKFLVAILSLGLLNAMSVGAQQRPVSELERQFLLGRHVKITASARESLPLMGELLAVNADSLWVHERGGGVRSLALVDVKGGYVQRHDFTGVRTMNVGLLAGAISGGLLTLACSRADGVECGTVLPVTVALSAVVSALMSISLTSSSRLRITTPTQQWLRQYARFPQGVPAGVDLATMASVPVIPPDL